MKARWQRVMISIRFQFCFLVTVAQFLLGHSTSQGQLADPWETEYAQDQATGDSVIGLWQFNTGQELDDSSSGNHALHLRGAKFSPDGKFGGCLECFPGWPVRDEVHSATALDHPALSPAGPFTLEMWVNTKPEIADVKGNCFLLDKKYAGHTDFQLILDAPQPSGGRTLRANLGFGQDSESWYSDEPLQLTPGVWTHLAFTYDGAGTGRFYVNGIPAGHQTIAGRGSISPGPLGLSIGDRLGSNYGGFSGYIDQVRISSGIREFRYLSVSEENPRHVFVRGEASPELVFHLTNHHRQPLRNLSAQVSAGGWGEQITSVKKIESGKNYEIRYSLNTLLRADRYPIQVQVTAELDRTEGKAETNAVSTLQSTESFDVTIVPRPNSQRMPVVMWGIGGIDGVVKEIPRLKEIGFTHCLGLSCDYNGVWEAGEPVVPTTPAQLKAADRMLDAALENDLGIIISLSPGHWLDNKPEMLRVDRDGKAYARKNVANAFPELTKFFYNVGVSAARQWAAHPAFQAALIDTEVRDGTSPSFHPAEKQAFRDFAGYDIPDLVQQPWGVHYSQIKDFPADRIVPDDQPELNFYRWFWKSGDGWNDWHTAMHEGFHAADHLRKAGPPLWTFFDPAVRVPSLYGSGGNVDYISHWTYTYPDPQRIGLCTDELLAMARGSGRTTTPQQVMKMTQIIWYRSQTAPVTPAADNQTRSPWEDYDPDAAYITISPMHLREALWTKLSRPIQGIMYHGWQSLVPGEKSVYRYTHPETQHELSRLVKSLVEPLGPTLKQIPEAKNDVAFLESFSSQMLARRGTYGWGTSWTADFWLVLQHAHLQADIVYDETIVEKGLSSYKVLVISDGDVLTRSVADRIREFQKQGGIVVADDRLAPGIKADITLKAYTRVKKGDVDLAALKSLAKELRLQLDKKYLHPADADNADVIVQRRRSGESDYLFAINDKREFGSYVGQHGLVMEQGLPSRTDVTLQRPGVSFVYDLRRGRSIEVKNAKGSISWNVNLAPCDGGLFLITPRPISDVQIRAAESVNIGESLSVSMAINDNQQKPISAVIPLRIDVTDPDGRLAEPSGYYAATDGEYQFTMDMAPNDVPGVWTIRVEEGASGLVQQHFVRVTQSENAVSGK